MTTPTPGRLFSVEIHSGSPEATVSFYEAVAGWAFEQTEGFPIQTILARAGGPHIGHLVPRGDEGPVVGAPINGAVLRIVVADVDAAMQVGRQHGGMVALPATDYPGIGRVGHMIDPDANVVALISPA